MYIGIIVATTPELSLFHIIYNSYCFEICNYRNTGNYPIVKSAILLLVFVVSVEALTSQLGITERLVFSFTSFILSCLQAPHLPAGFFKRDSWFSSLSFIIRCTFLLISLCISHCTLKTVQFTHKSNVPYTTFDYCSSLCPERSICRSSDFGLLFSYLCTEIRGSWVL